MAGTVFLVFLCITLPASSHPSAGQLLSTTCSMTTSATGLPFEPLLVCFRTCSQKAGTQVAATAAEPPPHPVVNHQSAAPPDTPAPATSGRPLRWRSHGRFPQPPSQSKPRCQGTLLAHMQACPPQTTLPPWLSWLPPRASAPLLAVVGTAPGKG